MKLTQRQQDKLIEAAQNAISFTVTGEGAFPFDMLRYDKCWPAWEDQSNLLGTVGAFGTRRNITLSGLKQPTVARWKSYGWEVREVQV